MILAGDVGGTSTRLALFERGEAGARALVERCYADEEFADFAALLARFVEEARAALGAFALERACLGVAGPVEPARVRLTNRPWTIEARELSTLLGTDLTLLNDFEAAAHGIDPLARDALMALQPGVQRPAAAQLVIGAGTGLGVAYRVWCRDRYRVVTGEGGHVGFAPATGEQLALARWLFARHGRVSAEQVVSGPGLARIYAFLRAAGGASGDDAEPPELISARALEGSDPVASHALDLFIACYGAVTGDHALAVRAAGGVYVAGGIARRILPRLAAGGFISSFNSKAVHERLTREFPVFAVLSDRLGLLGAAHVALAGGGA